MKPITRHPFAIAAAVLCAAALLSMAWLAEAHGVLKEPPPAENSVVKGPDLPIKLRYNVRVDSSRSKLQLLMPDNSTSDLAIGKQSAPDPLDSKATGLKPGAYRIRWQVLAPDGHITRGEVPFTVAAS